MCFIYLATQSIVIGSDYYLFVYGIWLVNVCIKRDSAVSYVIFVVMLD